MDLSRFKVNDFPQEGTGVLDHGVSQMFRARRQPATIQSVIFVQDRNQFISVGSNAMPGDDQGIRPEAPAND